MLCTRYGMILGLALYALMPACKAKIGDECKRSTECSRTGERICDLSHRVNSQGVVSLSGQGECTIEGCGRGSCPKEAECVRIYGSDFLTVSCEPSREDVARACDPDAETCADDCVESSQGGSNLVCPPRDDCNSNEICLPEGLCADEITSRTSCRRECKDNGDCRNGYECKRTGSDGVYRVFDPKDPTDDSQVKICRPVG